MALVPAPDPRSNHFHGSALVFSVVSFMLNATMLSPAIRDINTHLGPNPFRPISSSFCFAGAIGNVVLIRWSGYIAASGS